MGRMKTRVVKLPNEKLLWEGDLPVVPAGHRINHEGVVYKVVGSGIALTGNYPTDLDHQARQTLVLQEADSV